jgi:ABC-type uncharacterized transport system auxiliary subunit
MKKSVLIVSGMVLRAVVLTGCAGKVRRIESYTFDTPVKTRKAYSSKFHNKILMVDYPGGIGHGMSDRIYYRKGDIESSYLYSRWSVSQNRLLMARILKIVRNSSIFKEVLDYASEATPDYLLESRIYAFRHMLNKDGSSYALIDIVFRLLRYEDHKVVKSVELRYEEPCESTDARGFVRAAERAMRRLGDDLVEWLAK